MAAANYLYRLMTFICLALVSVVYGQVKIVLTNDDGWATANIRAQNDALKDVGFDVSHGIFSSPFITEVCVTGCTLSTFREPVWDRLG